MMMVDVDNFKLINDTYGHMLGDAVLQEISAELQHLFRSDDVIARIGGDEFLIFMRDVQSREIVEQRAEKVIDAFRTVLRQNMDDLRPSCSIGIAFCPEDGSSFEKLFRHSDIALYDAKSRGKNCYMIYDGHQQ